ncbi:helix-turn-helix transcriptional regulator [Sphingomonas sp. S2-65]|uniref:helix-turn-helix transcriptional regulator n=1 Tax=Sphingomonas sp. S2-65 TaxID=2903960 RepID=UPI0021BC439A|nr:YafY family protein [Sphingomonas sp. S2-65]UYY57234.1 YafY family transcriptional regulator [Sphingomonas sp. S2-65]
MSRSSRLLRLLHAMRTLAGPITAARLAEETGVSPRSVYRDIDALRAAGAQIEGERGYGYRLLEDPALPPQMLDEDEIEVLALGLAEVRAWGDPALAQAADSVLAKIAATLPDDRERQLLHAIAQVFRPEPRYILDFDLAPLRAACWREQAIDICYVDGDGARSQRTILPLSLFYTEECVTVLSWCCLREDFRMFRTDRIAEVRPNGASFRPRRVPLLRDYLARLRERRGSAAMAAQRTSHAATDRA